MRHIVFTALAVVALLLGGLVAPSHAGDIRFGRVWAADKVLREGCHGYRYQYVVRPRTNNWALETFLRGPSGRMIASGGFHFGADPKRGDGRFRFCNDVTRPGRFKISGKLTWKSCDILGHCTKHVRWVKPGYFRMRRP
ncbi:MAG TPA: hypothetical protein VFY58_11580 [Nocardioides sp.]|nr:hypothetical protein [Nocardioides sp.]